MIKRLSLVTSVSLMLVATVTSLHGQGGFRSGDVIVAGWTVACQPPAPLPRIRWFASEGTAVGDLGGNVSYSVRDVTFGRSGDLFVLIGNVFYGKQIYKFAAGEGDPQPFGPALEGARAIVSDGEGNVYVAETLYGYQEFWKINPSGTVLAKWRVPECCLAIGSLDLGIDQCVLYYAAGDYKIFRFDLCRGVALAPIPLPTYVSKIRILKDGTLLVGARDMVLRVDDTGAVKQTYSLNGRGNFGPLALTVDGSSFWTAVVGFPLCAPLTQLYQFDLETAAVLRAPIDVEFAVEALAVFGEPRTSLTPHNVPAVDVAILALLAIVFAYVGLYHSR